VHSELLFCFIGVYCRIAGSCLFVFGSFVAVYASFSFVAVFVQRIHFSVVYFKLPYFIQGCMRLVLASAVAPASTDKLVVCYVSST
jgi:hypothetical protein